MSYETEYAAKKRAQEEARANSPEAVESRLIQGEILAQVRGEMAAKFPVYTAENFEAANRYREDRIKELRGFYDRWSIRPVREK